MKNNLCEGLTQDITLKYFILSVTSFSLPGRIKYNISHQINNTIK